MVLDDLVFRLEHFKDEKWELGEKCFRFYKTKSLVDQYEHFWRVQPDFKPVNVFELGIWNGGSVAFWFECLQPEKHVAVDIMDWEDSAYFSNYIRARGYEHRIKTYWKTNQSDATSLRRIASTEFTSSLDLIIDDASHLYVPTKSSFEALFPLLRPGGLYIIEDWAWGHWEGCVVGEPGTELTRLVAELVEATGSDSNLIAQVTVFRGFAVVERGEVDAEELVEFKLNNHIYRHPPLRGSLLQRMRRRFTAIATAQW